MSQKGGLPALPGSKKVYFLISIAAIIEALFIISQATFLARSITSLFAEKHISDVFPNILLFLGSFYMRHLFSFIQKMSAEKFVEQTGKLLRKQLVSTYFTKGYSFVQTRGTGRLVTLAMEGIDQIKTYIELAIPKMIRSFILPALLAIYIFTIDKTSAIIVIVAIPIIVLFMILLGLAAQNVADKQYQTFRILANHFTDSLKGLETLTYLGRSVEHGKQIEKVSENYRKATNKTLRFAFLSTFALDFFTSLAIAFVAVGLGFRLIDGVLTLHPALTILLLAPEYFSPIQQVGKDYHATLDGQLALDEIKQIISMNDQKQTIQQRQIPWKQNSSIKLQNITVMREQTKLLRNISFSWHGPGMIGIVGASGAGKSTLIQLLAGLIDPTNGTITINDDSYNTLRRKDWLEQVAYIPQHPYIFPTSLANNIRFYEPGATDKQVEQVIQQIGLTSFVDELPQGIHEQIGEGGRSLSGGQEQRIALARALLSKRPILILDEPTAHLDIETEYELKQIMLKIFQHKLIFFATHRMHWINEMDHLLILDHGKIIKEKN